MDEIPWDNNRNTRIAPASATRARLLIVAATLLWSTSGFFTKAPLLEFWSPQQRGIQLAFWRVLFACVLLVPLVRRPRWTWRLVPAGISFALMNICFLMAMTTTTEANAIWLQYTAPAIVLIAGVWFMNERAVRADYLMMALSLTGVCLIVFFECRAAARQDYSAQGVFWGLASGATFAGVILSIRALRDVDSAWVVAVCLLCAAAALAPVIISQAAWPSPPVLGWVAAFGLLQLGLPYLLFAHGTRTVSGHEAAFIGLLEPLLVPLWAFLVWRHTDSYTPPAIWTMVGGALILLGLVLRYGPRSAT
jgi:DME family drug/metabolite transporter